MATRPAIAPGGSTDQAQASPPAAAGERVSSSDYIVRAVKEQLYDGRFAPGQQLTESELTRRFGVGRSSVREALKRLAAEGVVTISLHRGARIRSLTRKDVQDGLKVTEALAALAARTAAERAHTPSEIKTLRATLKSLRSGASERAPNDAPDGRRFYEQLAKMSGNDALERIFMTALSEMIRLQFRPAYGPEVERQRLGAYAGILEAILANDPAKAERALHQHLRRISKLVDTLPDDLFAVPSEQPG